ncbi:secretory subunit [Rhodotorula mucilaginosa]|uniref:Secretory subunit n=1 Tax=Rhodotorula mucilaginosa TaxID=5537 RepID=A0A9P6VXL3_RHOMI|nr:secretory subunit [Rhodotorula mucilaginosa]
MAGSYTYDTSGQVYFFILTGLLVFLLPYTYATLFGGAERAAARVKAPCAGWNRKSAEVKRTSTANRLFSVRHIVLAVGWLAFAVVVQRARGIEGEGPQFDPFAILGVSSSSTEKQIKKHYRKLSLKFHPDKVSFTDDAAKEEADSHFVELTKAYKALTDEVSRRNYELYGHPDGKQEFSAGIALPAWIVEGKNSPLVIGAYALLLGVVLPVLVGRWWYGTRKLTKDGVLNSTAAKYFHALKEETTFPQLLDILASSDEFAVDPALVKLRKSHSKAAVDEYARLVSTVREGVDGKQGWEGYATWTPAKKRARVFIAAHLLRLPIQDVGLLKEKHLTASIALPLCSGLASISLAHNWLSTYIAIVHLQQFLLQAVHPSSPQLLQLPHITPDLAVQIEEKTGVSTVKQFGELKAGQVDKVLDGLPEAEKRDAYEVAKHWPIIQFVDAKFQVTGEKIVTPGAIVSFTLKLRLAPPGQAPQATAAADSLHDAGNAEGEEKSVEELIGRSKADEGVVPTPLAHAPHFPKNRKPAWYIFVGDHKLNRVFVAPHRFTDIGEGTTRTVRMTFQAPPGPGLYTFQVYVMCDSFVGADAQKDMRMQVEPPKEGEDDVSDVEDDISEPDEDSLAGQMALMKGQPVRRHGDSDEEGSDDESETESESESSSDSDSDSD